MRRLSMLAMLLASFSVCFADKGKDESGKGKGRSAKGYREGGDRDDRDSYFHRRGYSRLTIPPGHYPPPGECRIWFPGRPPGQQPPPGDCRRVSARVPPGAWVIRHPPDLPDHVHVSVYDNRRPGSVLVVGEFKIVDGEFVRVVVDK